MSWGDPYAKFYKDEDDDAGERRRYALVERELVPGAMVSYGVLGSGKTLHVWDFPDLQSDSHPVTPGVAVIIGVDCESDPTADWLFLLLNTPTRVLFGWLPTSMVKRLE